MIQGCGGLQQALEFCSYGEFFFGSLFLVLIGYFKCWKTSHFYIYGSAILPGVLIVILSYFDFQMNCIVIPI
ncbi:MAG: hypothetical protein LBD69_02240 [Puniceicoccales bacterium]|jgi:hypothetical protein|nr:hypothetical protein [Puniceicoccales bacterium]